MSWVGLVFVAIIDSIIGILACNVWQ